MIPNEITSALENHLWQSTVLVAIVWMLALALKKNHARVRYWVWMAASVKFLLPFSLLMAAGEWVRTLMPTAAVARPEVVSAMEQLTQPFAEAQHFGAVAPVEAHHANWLPCMLLAMWACGAAAVVSRLCGDGGRYMPRSEPRFRWGWQEQTGLL